MAGVPMKPTKIERTSAGLRDALFDAIEKLRSGDIEAQDAKALAALSHQICATVSLEIEVAKLRTEYPADTKLSLPAALPLGIASTPAEGEG
jgi:hypothetical protein